MSSTNVTRLSVTIGLLVLAAAAAGANALRTADASQARDQAQADATTRQLIDAARKADADGQHELAINYYVKSIDRETESREKAIEELVNMFVARAMKAAENRRFVEESNHLKQCCKTLTQLKNKDSGLNFFDEATRARLFSECDTAKELCQAAAKRHIDTARQLQCEAKGAHWWKNDDEDLQKQALHHVNLAWRYSDSLNEEMKYELFDIWAEMKSELGSKHFTRATESDRLTVGIVMGE